MKEAANGVLAASLLRRTRTVRLSRSLAAALFATSLIGLGGFCLPKAGGLGSLGRPLGRMLKDALGAGVVNELAAGDQTFGHGHLAPGAEPVG